MSQSSGKMGSNQEPDYTSKSLPQEYGNTEAALLPRDPFWMFIYWEISDKTKNEILSMLTKEVYEKSRYVIRTYEVGENDSFVKYYDTPVIIDAKNWYLNVPECGKTYMCEIGLITPDGKFIGIVKTNKVSLPRTGVSDVIDEKYMRVSEEFEKLLQISGIDYIGKGSFDIAKTLAQRWELLRAMFSRITSFNVSSFSSQSIMKERMEQEKKFWLVADCELIVYGATQPDAKLYVGDREIRLNPDGSFAIRYSLPENTNSIIPIKAISKDGDMKRGITIKVNRENNENE